MISSSPSVNNKLDEKKQQKILHCFYLYTDIYVYNCAIRCSA